MKKLFILLLLAVLYSSQVLSQDIESNKVSDADHLISNYQFDRALIVLRDPEDSLNIEVIQRKGYCYFRLGNYADAIRQYEQIIKIDSTNRNALHQLGQLYSRNNQYENASKCYQKLIASDSMNSFYYKQYGNVASQANNSVVAVINYLHAISLNPKDLEAYLLVGNELLENEQYELADTILTQSLQVHKSPQLRLLLAKAQLGEERYSDVIKTIEPLVTRDTIPAYSRLLGISYFQTDQFEKVIPCMQLLLSMKTKAEWIYYYLGVSYQQLNKPDSAIANLNRAIDAGISANISTYYTQLATSYESVSDFKSAIKYYKAAYESSRSDILLFHLARSYDVFYKDKTKAITYYKRYLSSDDTIKVAKEYTRFRLDELSVYR